MPEIESCSSGGARVDLGILEHADRIWASDCIDPLERLGIMRWTTTQLIPPPELTGSHLGSGRSHPTGRSHELSFRAAAARLGHFGIEWNINALNQEELAELAAWVRVHKQLPLLHSGRTVRGDVPGGEISVPGVVAAGGSEAVFALAVLVRPATWPPGLVRLPGLDPDRQYVLRQLGPGLAFDAQAPWWQRGTPSAQSGRVLAVAGIQLPPLQPEYAFLAHLTAVAPDSPLHAPK